MSVYWSSGFYVECENVFILFPGQYFLEKKIKNKKNNNILFLAGIVNTFDP